MNRVKSITLYAVLFFIYTVFLFNWSIKNEQIAYGDNNYFKVENLTYGIVPDIDTFTIDSTKGLDKLAELVNNGMDFNGLTILLTDNIYYDKTINNHAPIGQFSYFDSKPFRGIFDGQGYTIQGISIDTTSSYIGLFGLNSGIIKNVNIIDSTFLGFNYVGAIAGNNLNGSIYNCYVDSVIVGQTGVGGIVGDNDGAIYNCYNNGEVRGATKTGGIAGINSGIVEGSYNLGIITGAENTGGIVGENSGDIKNCFNASLVYASNTNTGGIAGIHKGNIIENCYNAGTIYSEHNNLGGIAGLSSAHIKNVYNTGDLAGLASNVGGIIGYIEPSILENCYNNSKINGYLYRGNIIGSFNLFNTGLIHISNAYFNSQANIYNGSGSSVFNGIKPLKYDEMTMGNLDNYTGFDSADWIHNEREIKSQFKNSYTPQLQAFIDNSNFIKSDYIISYNQLEVIAEYTHYYASRIEFLVMSDGVYSVRSYKDLEFMSTTSGLNDYYMQERNIINIKRYTLKKFDNLIVKRVNNLTIGQGNNPFNGIYDGNGYYIKDIFIDNNLDNQALFSVNYGTIRNVKLIDSYISGGYMTGGIVSENYGVVTACYTNAQVIGKGDNTGGIASYNNQEINNCYVDAVIMGYDFIGGIAGENDENGRIIDSYASGIVNGDSKVGGICGINMGHIESVYNDAIVRGNEYLGGIVGVNDNSGYIYNSYNESNIIGSNIVGGICGINMGHIESVYNDAIVQGNEYLGGIVGVNDNSGYIYNSYNEGDIIGSNIVGGICGINIGLVESSHNLGKVSAQYDYVGGIAGYVDYGTIRECINIGELRADGNIGGITGRIENGVIAKCINLAELYGNSSYIGGIVGDYDAASLIYDNVFLGSIYGGDNTGGMSGNSNIENNAYICDINGTINVFNGINDIY